MAAEAGGELVVKALSVVTGRSHSQLKSGGEARRKLVADYPALDRDDGLLSPFQGAAAKNPCL